MFFTWISSFLRSRRPSSPSSGWQTPGTALEKKLPADRKSHGQVNGTSAGQTQERATLVLVSQPRLTFLQQQTQVDGGQAIFIHANSDRRVLHQSTVQPVLLAKEKLLQAAAHIAYDSKEESSGSTLLCWAARTVFFQCLLICHLQPCCKATISNSVSNPRCNRGITQKETSWNFSTDPDCGFMKLYMNTKVSLIFLPLQGVLPLHYFFLVSQNTFSKTPSHTIHLDPPHLENIT